MSRNNVVSKTVFLLPSIILFLLIYALSIVSLFATSFTDWSIGRKEVFVGIKNYVDLFVSDESFIIGLFNTIKWMILQSTVHVIIGTLVALILFKKEFYWKFVRTVIMIPNVISSAALGILFFFMYTPDFGLVNSIIRIVSGNKEYSQMWLSDYSTAFFSVTMIWLPFAAVITILVLGELNAIPKSQFEAIKVDGANEFQTVLYMIIPNLKNILGTCVIISGTGMLQKMDIILMVTGGGPGYETLNLPVYIYKTALVENNFGYANSAGVILILLGVLFVLLVRKLFNIGKSNE